MHPGHKVTLPYVKINFVSAICTLKRFYKSNKCIVFVVTTDMKVPDTFCGIVVIADESVVKYSV